MCISWMTTHSFEKGSRLLLSSQLAQTRLRFLPVDSGPSFFAATSAATLAPLSMQLSGDCQCRLGSLPLSPCSTFFTTPRSCSGWYGQQLFMIDVAWPGLSCSPGRQPSTIKVSPFAWGVFDNPDTAMQQRFCTGGYSSLLHDEMQSSCPTSDSHAGMERHDQPDGTLQVDREAPIVAVHEAT